MFAALLVGSAVSTEATQAFPWEWWRMVRRMVGRMVGRMVVRSG